MSEYTPTTEQVRATYLGGTLIEFREEGFGRFQRWLAEVERAAAAKALTDAAGAIASAEINLEVFGDPSDRERWGYSNDTRQGIVESLRKRAAALGMTAEQEGEKDE